MALYIHLMIDVMSVLASLSLYTFRFDAVNYFRVPRIVRQHLRHVPLNLLFDLDNEASKKFSTNPDESQSSNQMNLTPENHFKSILKTALSVEYETDLKLEIINNANRSKQKSTTSDYGEDYRMKILKNILECERGLLSIKFNRSKLESFNRCELFKEWLIVAILADRVYLFLFLCSFVSLLILFLLV